MTYVLGLLRSANFAITLFSSLLAWQKAYNDLIICEFGQSFRSVIVSFTSLLHMLLISSCLSIFARCLPPRDHVVDFIEAWPWKCVASGRGIIRSCLIRRSDSFLSLPTASWSFGLIYAHNTWGSLSLMSGNQDYLRTPWKFLLEIGLPASLYLYLIEEHHN